MAVDQGSRLRAPDRTATPPQRLRTLFDRGYGQLTERPLSLYAAAVMRIGFGLVYVIFLVREFPHRHQIWGLDSPWTQALARQMFDQTGWFSVLTFSGSRAYFEACYLVALLVAVLFMLGWRTRAVSIVFAIMVVSFYGRNVLISDSGDTLTLLMSIYLCFTACGRRWSLDARRGRARASGLRAQIVTVVHNCAMVVIMVQMCILYGAASLYKVQGDMWGDGTALHYVLNLDLFRPWPALSHFMDGHHLVIAVVSYLTVLVQIAFPFSLFSKLKYVILAVLTPMHLGIAVLLGLPLFSGVMIIADAVFLPDRFYQSLGPLWRRLREARRPAR